MILLNVNIPHNFKMRETCTCLLMALRCMQSNLYINQHSPPSCSTTQYASDLLDICFKIFYKQSCLALMFDAGIE